MKRLHLRSKDASKELTPYAVTLSKKDVVEVLENKHKIMLINHLPAFFYYETRLIPTLKFLQANPHLLKAITIDMGAIKFIIQGADLMRPGITAVDESIKTGEIIIIKDKKNQKPVALGMALFSGEEIKMMSSGKVVKNIHYVGDELWKLEP